ncbi:MAG: spermidine synthase [Deltaproteobacteria bacterium]|nr:spermidine synthase [Deltaproteobacteria bacterium]
MALPWKTLDSVSTGEGPLELRCRGGRDYLITVAGRVLMSSAAHRSEEALGELACAGLVGRRNPEVLVGGLGMGYTLRTILNLLPPGGRVRVAEINPTVVGWCRGPLAGLTERAVDDPRVTVEVADVAAVIRRFAKAGEVWDAVVLDLYQGPHLSSRRRDHPLYGTAAVEATRRALRRGGVFAVWGEDHDPGFEKTLRHAGFSVRVHRPVTGARRHVVYLGRAPAARRPRRGLRRG